MSTSQLALGSVTLILAGTLSFMAVTDRIKPEAYIAGMMGIFASWLKTDDSKETPTITTKDRPRL